MILTTFLEPIILNTIYRKGEVIIMKKIMSLVMAMILSLSVLPCFASTGKAADNKISLLFIGNSYAEDSARQHLYNILTELGYNDVEIGILKISSCSLEMHKNNLDNDNHAYTYFHISSATGGEVEITENKSIADAVDSYDWEYVSLQQESSSSGLAETYSDASYIYTKVLEKLPAAKLLWNMIWAYGVYSGSENFAIYSNDQKLMYNAITNAVKTEILPMGNVTVIPTGTAIQNARTCIPWSLITRDEHHLGYSVGRYIAALTVAGGITDRDVSGIAYTPEGVEPEIKEKAVQSAVTALQNPYEITDLKATDIEPKPSFFKRIIMFIKSLFEKIAALFGKK